MAASLSAAASSGTLLPPSFAVPPSRLSSSRSLVVRMPFLTGRTRLVSKAAQLRQQRSYVAQRAAQAEAEEVKEQQETEESEAEATENATEPTDGRFAEESTSLTVQALLQNYRDAISNDDETGMAVAESQLQFIEEERAALLQQVSTLTEEVSAGKDRFLRLNADFANFRKRSERDRIAMNTTVKGDVISSLLPVIDNFERAKAQIKIETEGEQRIDNSYQGIYKQFVEIMKGSGVSVVETVGKKFDPNVHEAIMREESTEYAEGLVTEEFRRGFVLGDRLLRPAMVKVSAGPSSAKSESAADTGVVPEEVEGEAE